MASIVFAAVIATVLFLAFERTRAFGIVGIFALIALEPLWFTLFFAFVGLAYLHFRHERK